MRIPKKVLIIGLVEEITYRKDNSRTPTTINFSAKKGDFLLAVNPSYTTLFIFESSTTGKVEIIRDKNGIQSGMMHQIIRYQVPELELKKLGSAITIRYRSTWWEGDLMEYRHDFKNADFYGDSYTRIKSMGIKLKKGKILNSRGIV